MVLLQSELSKTLVLGRGGSELNISFPATGCQKLIEVEDEHKLRTFHESCMATEVAADTLNEEWKGYMVRISSGNDKQGFPMKQVKGTPIIDQGELERKHKSVQSGTVNANLRLLYWVTVERRYSWSHCASSPGAQRASRTFQSLKADGVRPYAVRKPLNKEGKKPRTKAPKIQCLVTPRVLQLKRRHTALQKQRTKKNKEEAAEHSLLAKGMRRQRKTPGTDGQETQTVLSESFYL
ncbi:hypothetical protein QTO34_003009 [Cnephaeus nilssonii]|uniref:40S ribosomal protein S6 n=1 Tax=Cnephaeus nilssonii TaxID=3371016 RepID=A0AA40HTD2_CNENI|nr:hypothetical protein QTO34_003009 [Eptesicus nilssonii]